MYFYNDFGPPGLPGLTKNSDFGAPGLPARRPAARLLCGRQRLCDHDGRSLEVGGPAAASEQEFTADQISALVE